MRLAVLASLAALTACHSQPPPVPAAAPRPSGTRPLPVEDRTTVAPTTAAPAPTTAARPRRAVRPTTTVVAAEGNEGAAAQTAPAAPPAPVEAPTPDAGLPTARVSWYGAESGSRTANGEAFDGSGLTFAHRTMAFGSLVRFCHGDACVVARCTDRGPAAWTGKTFDLSRAAFAAVAPLSRGVVTVTWEAA